MRILGLFLMTLVIFSFFMNKAYAQNQPANNAELIKIYSEDQNDRRSTPIDWQRVSKRDSLRRVRVYQLLDSNKVQTALDYKNAAMVFQHGNDTSHYAMAVKLMEKSVHLDPYADKWLLAAATDRYLLSVGKPQIYGTQFMRMQGAPWKRSKMDSTQITDRERKAFGVETLAQQKEKLRRMNLKQLEELILSGKSITEVIEIIQHADRAMPYDTSENGLNNLGYFLMAKKRYNDAKHIFKLNVQRHPKAFNTYDSYGECLYNLGEIEAAIEAYKKSLKFNPKNKNATEMIQKMILQK